TLPSGGLYPHDAGPLSSWVVDILPYIDQQSLYNQYDRKQVYYSLQTTAAGSNNYTVATTDISTLRCPHDDSVVSGKGNLTYVCNSGFNLWWFSVNGFPVSTSTGAMNWSPNIAKRSGLMWPGTYDGNGTLGAGTGVSVEQATSINSVTDGVGY